MNTRQPSFDPERRRFVGACCAAVGATGMLSTLAQLRVLGAVANPGNGPMPSRAGALPNDYKALVCLFLAGGNDSNNLIVPSDASGYSEYASSRGVLALPREQLITINPLTSDGRQWGLHPSFSADVSGAGTAGLKSLFDTGKMALVANVGTLVVPTTRAQYTARAVPLPRQLFSHNNQQVEWQSSLPDKPFTSGWGGRLADLTNALNENNTISMSISLSGQNSFQVGSTVSQFSVKRSGVVSLSGSSDDMATAAGIRTQAQSDLLAMQNANLFETAFSGITTNAVSDSALVATFLEGDPPFTTAFSTSSLGQQLSTIARLIAAAPQLGLKRQIFFARIGGWDLHNDQLDAHANLLADVSSNVAAFYQATAELGAAEQVTTFTASDFGRTFNTNGDGSDHGWGANHFVVGGAVRGGDLYGQMPNLILRGPDDSGRRGTWIPTTSVDEYAATLATWFGVSPTDLPVVLPNIGNFSRTDLGFL